MTGTQAQTTAQGLRATPSRHRALAPDLGRGLMLALIAVANVMIYLIGRPYGYRQHIVEEGVVDHAVSAVVVTLVDGRALPLFAFLFGYGIVQLAVRQQARGGGPGTVRSILVRRNAGLIVLGALHGVLLFPGDILGWYGVIGLVLVALLRRSDRTLLALATLWLVPAAMAVGTVYSQPTADGGRGFFWSFEVGDPVQALGLRALEWVLAPFGVLTALTAALVGVVAARHRLLEEPEAHRRLLRRWALWGLVLAVAGGVPSGLVVGGYLPLPDPAVAWLLAVVHSFTGVAGGLGVAALFGLIALRFRDRPQPVVRALAATGRRSLSGYLFQSVVFVGLLGLHAGGLGAHLGTAAAAALGLGVWVFSVVVAAVLDRHSVRGPAEALLQRWTYRRATVVSRPGRG